MSTPQDPKGTQFKIHFEPSGRGKARCAPNPDYPDGVHIDCLKAGEAGCKIEFPYPASECGTWIASCALCGRNYAATAAGRPDDPRSMKVPCVEQESAMSGLNVSGFSGKWRSAQHLALSNERKDGNELLPYWGRVRLLFLELGGEYLDGHRE